jgi:alpha-L-arabinofuranosidase
MKKTTLFLHDAFMTGEVKPEMFGAFVEHMGRCVYGGFYDPGHKTAQKDGFRRDVIDAVRTLGVPIVRYPGGNFVSGYDFKTESARRGKQCLTLRGGKPSRIPSALMNSCVLPRLADLKR